MDLPIPPSFKVGHAKGHGDCFYDAVAQGLNQIKPKSKFTVKSLRMLCKDYAVKQTGIASSWLRGALENKIENQHLDYYASCIEYCADDFANPRSKVMPFKLDNPIWGRPEIEGRIICDDLNVRLHVIEKQVVENETICVDQVVDRNSSRSINSVDYAAGDIAHIVNKGADHFEPLLRTDVQINAPTAEGVKKNAGKIISKGKRAKQVNKDIGASVSIRNPTAQSRTGSNASPTKSNDPRTPSLVTGMKRNIPVNRPRKPQTAIQVKPIKPVLTRNAPTSKLRNIPVQERVFPNNSDPVVAGNTGKKVIQCEEKEDVNEKPKLAIGGWYNQVVDGSGSKSVDSVDYDAHDTVHILNAGDLHFNPILRKDVPNQESDHSSLSSSDETKTELGEKLIKIVRSQDSEEEKMRAILAILQQGADVNFKNANMNGNTAMHFAVKLNLTKVTKFLCEHGADANLKNSKNKTPLEMTSLNPPNIYTEILNSVSSKDDTNTRKFDKIIYKNIDEHCIDLNPLKEIIVNSLGRPLTEVESSNVNSRYLDRCQDNWLKEIQSTMVREYSDKKKTDIKATQTLDEVPGPFRESNFYKRLIQHKDLLDEGHKRGYVTCFRSQMEELLEKRNRRSFTNDEIVEITNNWVHDKKDLAQVMDYFNCLTNNEMNETDKKLIADRYIECCLQWFLQDVENQKDFDTSQIRYILGNLRGIGKLNEIEEKKLSPFDVALSYRCVMRHSSQLITEKLDQAITWNFKAKCLNAILSSADAMSREEQFLQSLSKYLDSVKDTDAISAKLGLPMFRNRSVSFNQLREKIMNSNDNNTNLSTLKAATRGISDKKIGLEEKLLELIRKYLVGTKIETKTLDARLVIEVTGYNITISRVIVKVEQQLRNNGKIEEVRFAATSTVHNDVCITDSSIWHGKNIVVVSRVLQTHGIVSWNVSGKDKNRPYKTSAKDGKQDGEHGHKGADGKVGESGGNVLIAVKEMENSENFTIISSGGSGGKGQDGGKGKDGADGHGITWDEFQTKFPPPSKTVAALRGDLVLKNITSMQEEMADLEFGWYKKLYGKSESCDKTNKYQSFVNRIKELRGKGTIVFLKGTTRQKNEITFAYHCGNPGINCQSYLLYKGAPGKAGSPGGEGGHGGDGGYGGEIKVLTPDSSVKIVADCGEAGENGKGGPHGECGKSAWDMGYMDYSMDLRKLPNHNTWPEYFGIDENQKLQLSYYDNDDYNRVTCPYLYSNSQAQQHIRIIEIPEPKNALKMYKERTQSKAVGAKQVETVAARQKAISYDTIHNTYSHITQNEFNLSLGLDELKVIAKEQLAEIESEQRTENIFQRRTTYSPPFSNPKKGESNPSMVIPITATRSFAELCQVIQKRSLSPETWKRNWLGIKTMEFGIANLQILFHILEKQAADGIHKQHALRVKRILEVKLKMATLANNANKLLDTKTFFGTPGVTEAACYLHEHQGGCKISCDELGPLSNYFCLDCQGNRSKVQETCRTMVANLVTDLQKAGHQENVEEIIQHSNNSVFVKTLRFYLQLERSGNCATNNMAECCQDNNITEGFLDEINKGPNSQTYRELLARFYKVNIRVYERETDKYVFTSDHNPEATTKIYFCKGDEHYTQLGMNESYWKLRNERKQNGAVYEKIIHDLGRRRREDYEDYFQKKPFTSYNDITLKCVPEYFPATEFGEIARRISLYFPGKETEIKNLFGRFDTPSCDTPQIIGIMGQILKRFTYDGNHITTLEMMVLVNAILTSIVEEEYRLGIIFWIVSAHSQRSWIVELLLLDLENCFKQQLNNKEMWHENLSRVQDKHILLLFKKKLDEQMQTDKIPIDHMKNITLRLHHANDITYMSNLQLADWIIPLKELHYTNHCKNFKNLNSSENLQTISHYLLGIENVFGYTLVTNLMETLNDKEPNISADNLRKYLIRFYNGTWQLNEQNLELISKQGIDELKNRHKKTSEDRTIVDLQTLIKGNSNCCEGILDKLDQYAEEVTAVKMKCDKCQCLVKTYLQAFKGMKSKMKDILDIKTQDSDSNEPKFIKQIALIIVTIEQKRKFKLRDTQILAILFLVRNEGNILLQVSTGEGKSLIVVAAAIVKALQGEKVHIITSNSVLAERDAVQNKDIYNEFNIEVSHNGDKDVEKRKDVYSKHQVVYGDISTFQGDYLLDKFYGKNILGDHKLENVIVDEVDSMLLDNGNNVLYLSHVIPGLDKLENIYIYIWERINTPAINQIDIIEALDSAKIKEYILNEMKCTVRKDHLELLKENLSIHELTSIREELMNSQIIGSHGEIMVRESELEDEVKHARCTFLDQDVFEARICYLIKQCLQRNDLLKVPNYLKHFVEHHLRTWIESAITAMFMKEGRDYVVDVDRTGTWSDRNPNITIIDRDTGTDQGNSQWEEALHQFLQLKHGCKLSMQSLKAVFISNVSYFKLYHKVSGITGTLGSQVERDLLKSVHQVDFMVIPTSKPQQFQELEAVICKDNQEWTQKILKECSKMIGAKRSCLVICDTINNVDVLCKQLKAICKDTVHMYKRDYEVLAAANVPGGLPTGQIIVATNLAGRGTDIKLSEDLKESGGLHVCLTYLPDNNRIEQQAYGRSARCGEKGSARLIIVEPQGKSIGSSHVFRLKSERDNAEAHRVSQMKLNYEQQIKIEESLFEKFTVAYECVRKKVNQMKKNRDQGEVAIQGCLDRWAFWLDANSHRIRATMNEEGRSTLYRSLDTFLEKLRELETSELEPWIVMDDDDTSNHILIPRAIQLGKLLAIGKHDEAIDIFNSVINKEPYFCEAAHYYKAFRLIQKKNTDEMKAELRKAARILEDRQRDVMNAAGLTNSYKECCNRTSIVQINAYKEQKQNEWRIYDILLRSINDILDQTVTPDSLIGAGIDTDNADAIYEALIETGLLEKPKIAFSQKDGDFEMLCMSNGICVDSFANFLKDRDGREFREQNFHKEFEQKIPLPMREVLWATLVEQKALKDVVKFVVVKKGEFSSLKANEADYKGDSGTQYIFLNLEFANTENTGVYIEKDFEEEVGSGDYVNLKNSNRVSVIERAVISPGNLETIKFANFDSLKLDDFQRTSIVKGEAQLILQIMEKRNILQKNGSEETYRLEDQFQWIKLPFCPLYENEVNGLLSTCFAYRIALQKIQQDVNSGCRQIELPLQSKPHQALMWELVCQNIIIPAQVTSKNADIAKALNEIINPMLTVDNKNYLARKLETLKNKCNSSSSKTVCLKPILEHISGKLSLPAGDINVFSLNGLGDVMIFSDRLTSAVIWNASAVILMGLAQMCAGCAIFIKTAGIFKPIARKLLQQGVGDIIFAVSAFRSRKFTWKDYGKHKWSNLANSSVSSIMSSIANYNLDSNTGHNEAGKDPVQKALSRLTPVFGKCLEKVGLETKLSTRLQGICEVMIRKALSQLEKAMDSSNFLSTIQEAYSHFKNDAVTKINEMIEEIRIGKTSQDTWKRSLKEIVEIIASEINGERNRSNNTGTSLQASIPHIKASMKCIVSELKKTIRQVTSGNENDKPQSSDVKYEKFQREVIDKLKLHVEEEVQKNILNPIMAESKQRFNNLVKSKLQTYNTGMFKVDLSPFLESKETHYKALQDSKKAVQTSVLAELEMHFREKHNEMLLKLRSQSKDPKLFAAMIRDNGPMDTDCLEALVKTISEMPEESEGFTVIVEGDSEDRQKFPTTNAGVETQFLYLYRCKSGFLDKGNNSRNYDSIIRFLSKHVKPFDQSNLASNKDKIIQFLEDSLLGSSQQRKECLKQCKLNGLEEKKNPYQHHLWRFNPKTDVDIRDIDERYPPHSSSHYSKALNIAVGKLKEKLDELQCSSDNPILLVHSDFTATESCAIQYPGVGKQSQVNCPVEFRAESKIHIPGEDKKQATYHMTIDYHNPDFAGFAVPCGPYVRYRIGRADRIGPRGVTGFVLLNQTYAFKMNYFNPEGTRSTLTVSDVFLKHQSDTSSKSSKHLETKVSK